MRPSTIVGKIDQIDNKVLRGWVFDPSRPTKRLTVDVFCDDLFLGQATAGFPRPDLKAAGFGDGNFQFRMDLSAVPETALEKLIVTISQEPDVQITIDGAIDRSRRLPHRVSSGLSGLRNLFEPLVRSALDGAGSPLRKPRSKNEDLVATASVCGLPLCAFSQHIAFKFDWPTSGAWTKEAFDSFLRWYVVEYSVAQAPKRVPWSEDEIAFWQGSGSRWQCVSRAAQRFSPRAGSPTRARAFYEWAVEDSYRLCVDDVFVGPELVRRLRTVPVFDAGRPFPLSRFMCLFLKENARLHGLGTKHVDQRQTIYAAVMLYGLTSPHLLNYLPSRWLAEMLGPGQSESPFEKAALTLGGQTSRLSAELYVQLLERRGYDVRGQHWTDHEKGRIGPSGKKGDTVFDVQLIGPFRRILGLGESARRIAAALMQCAVSVNLVDYDLGNASLKQDIDLPLAPVATAQITILHLNLEEIPEAIASLPDHISASYLVAFPYFELSAPSAAHRLGLRLVQEIWTASSFLQSVFQKACQRTYVIGMPAYNSSAASPQVDLDMRLSNRSFDESFVFLTTADALSWVQRKNVLGVLEAFQAAFGMETNVRLLVKTHNRQAAATTDHGLWETIIERIKADRRIDLIDETFDEDTYRALLSKVDCLVSLHRAEGLGLDLLDAMAMGTAVVATAYSGNSDSFDSKTCWLVSFDLVAVEPQDYPFVEAGHVWAEPHLKDAVRALRQVHSDADERAARTERAKEQIAAKHSLEAVSSRIAARLKALELELRESPDDRVRDAMVSAG